MPANEEIRIPIKVVGASKARRDIESLGQSGQKSAKGFKALDARFQSLQNQAQKLALAVGGVAAVGLKLGSDFQQIDRRLRSFSDSAEELEKNLRLLNDVSDRTRSRLTTNAAAFQRLALATRTVGGTSEQAAQILTTLNQAFAVGGASATEIAAATTQLGQALASGRLNGDELRSLTENASFLADALGNEIGGKGIASLRELSKQGKLTTDVLVDAFLKVGDDIEKQYQTLPKTLSEAFNGLNNELTRFGENLLPAIETAIKGLETLIVAATRAKGFIERLGRAQAIQEAEGDLASTRRSVDKRRRSAFPQGFDEFTTTRQIGALQQNNPTDPLLPSLIAQREKFLALEDQFRREIAAAQAKLDAVLQNDQTNLEQAQKELEELRARVSGTGGGRGSADGGYDPDQDPIVQAIEAQEEARRQSQTRTEEFTKEHLERMNEASKKQFEKDLERYRMMEDALTSVFQVAGDALLEYTRTGEFNFQDFATSILETLQEILIQALITQAVSALLGGAPTAPGAISGVGAQGVPLLPQFAGGFASGGTIPAGQFGLVGEQGPEFISGPATITPMGDAAAAPPVVNVYIGGEQIAPMIVEVMRSETGQRAQLENLNDKRTQTKRLLS